MLCRNLDWLQRHRAAIDTLIAQGAIPPEWFDQALAADGLAGACNSRRVW